MKIFLRILSYVKPYKKYIVISIICSVFYALLNGFTVYLTIPLLDSLFYNTTETAASQSEAFNTFLPDSIDAFISNVERGFKNFVFSGSVYEVLLKICGLIIVSFLLKNIFAYMQTYFLVIAEQGTVKDIRNSVYNKLITLPINYFKNEKTGNLISRIINDVTLIQQSITTIFISMIREPLSLIVLLGLALSISWKLTLFSLVVLPVSFGIIGYLGKKIRKQGARQQTRLANIVNILNETISGIKIIKAFSMEEYEINKFKNETRRYYNSALKLSRIRNAASPLTEFLSVGVGVLLIYYGGLQVLEGGAIKASQFIGFLFAIFQLITPIKVLSGVNNRIQESAAAGERFFNIFDETPEIYNPENSVSFGSFKNKISIKNVSYTYPGADRKALNSVSFEINKGETVALVGKSGAGKSTLIDMLPGFIFPNEGEITIDGIPINKMKLSVLRKLMGIVSQETVLFNDTVYANIAFGSDTGIDKNKIFEAARAAHAEHFIRDLEDGYETIIGEMGTKLSGGQRQRISIARALYNNPPVMILDEATSALDTESEKMVQSAIDELLNNRTTIVIAHRLSTIENADKIAVLDMGKLVQFGNHNDLIKDVSGIYHNLYNLQFNV